MRKETLGAALFFCGFGVFATFFDPCDSGILKFIVSVGLMIWGLRIGGC